MYESLHHPWLIAAGKGGSISCWNWEDFKAAESRQFTHRATAKVHKRWVSSLVSLYESMDSLSLLSAADDGSLVVSTVREDDLAINIVPSMINTDAHAGGIFDLDLINSKCCTASKVFMALN